MAGATLSVSAEQPAPPAYKLVQTIPLGPGERWDYATFDPSQGRVYVAHGDHVTVVNAGTGAIIGNIGPLSGGTHGIDVSPENGVGFTDDGEAGIAAAFDLKTLKIIKQIPTAKDADGVIFDPVSRHIFVINGDSGSITVIDPNLEWTVAPEKFLSKSRNTPFAGMRLKGRAVLTIVAGEIVYDGRKA